MILSLDYLSAKSINSSPLPSLETQLHFMVENLVMYPAFADASSKFADSSPACINRLCHVRQFASV